MEVTERPFAKSTLQLFRSQLVVHEKARAILARSIAHARSRGLLGGRGMKLATDTTAILGRGAVRDAYNLIGDGVRLLIRALAEREGAKPEDFAAEHGYSLYVGKSLKGGADIDWSDRRQRRGFLGRIVKDADSLLERARGALAELPGDSPQAPAIESAAHLLARILIQDIERRPSAKPDREPTPGSDDPGKDQPELALEAVAGDSGAGAEADTGAEDPEIVKGGGRDRVLSVHDPQMRHGRKSAANRFAGHKGAIVVEPDSGVICAVDVIPGNAPDSTGALELVRQAERNAASSADRVIGDCAYGDGGTRQEFADAGYDLFARLPGRPKSDYFHKQDFAIDLDAGTCTCPAGQTTSDYRPARPPKNGKPVPAGRFHFAREQCGPCPLRERCIASKTKPNRRIGVHPQEKLLQQARVRQRSAEGRALGRLRIGAEHRLARLCQLGVRQSRFFGRELTAFQLLMAAAVANLTLAEGIGKTAKRPPPDGDPDPAPEPAAGGAGWRQERLRTGPAREADAAPETAPGRRPGSREAGGTGVAPDGNCRPAASGPLYAPQAGSGRESGSAVAGRVAGMAAAVGCAAGALGGAIAGTGDPGGVQGALYRLMGRRDGFGVIANPFAARCAILASRPGL